MRRRGNPWHRPCPDHPGMTVCGGPMLRRRVLGVNRAPAEPPAGDIVCDTCAAYAAVGRCATPSSTNVDKPS